MIRAQKDACAKSMIRDRRNFHDANAKAQKATAFRDCHE
jgi:hypothetical protein